MRLGLRSEKKGLRCFTEASFFWIACVHKDHFSKQRLPIMGQRSTDGVQPFTEFSQCGVRLKVYAGQHEQAVLDLKVINQSRPACTASCLRTQPSPRSDWRKRTADPPAMTLPSTKVPTMYNCVWIVDNARKKTVVARGSPASTQYQMSRTDAEGNGATFPSCAEMRPWSPKDLLYSRKYCEGPAGGM